MALAFLPSEHIATAFQELNQQAISSEVQPMVDLTNYIRHTWIEGTVWKPENWSVFKETIRTNNDTEGKFDLFSSFFFFLSYLFSLVLYASFPY